MAVGRAREAGGMGDSRKLCYVTSQAAGTLGFGRL
jgi:hypothetical protein